MSTYISMKTRHEFVLPAQFKDDDVRYPGALVRHFLDLYTHPGDIVLDPFAGFGTTLYTAEAEGRIAYGLEYDRQRADFIRANLQHKERLIQGDARRLSTYDLPSLDFSMTSPPFTSPQDQENPLTAYQTMDGRYENYLSEIGDVYRQLSALLKPGARAVVEASNLKHELGVTPLAWHIAEQVSQFLHFEGEIVVCWDHYGYGYDHSYCLVFSR
jgi:DNA modification methylase